MTVLGRLALDLSLLFALAGIAFLAVALRTGRRDLLRHGYYAVYAGFLGVAVAAGVLLLAFLRADMSFAYVAGNSSPDLSVFYRMAGFWAGQEGSLLFWSLLLAAATVTLALGDLTRLRPLTGGAVLSLSAVWAVFAALMVFDAGSNPFLGTGVTAAEPRGLNPLLLHPAMVLHPPALFAGYVGLAVPFAFAASALLLARGDDAWVRASRAWGLAGWLFLSLGIGLGAWWAYVVLSFGGYWAWDPVENSSLVPWLTATALLHSMTLYVRRGVLRRWALSLAVATFWLTIVATWTTRSGLIDSVHAFGQRPVLAWTLSAFVLAVAALGAGLIVWRRSVFASDMALRSLWSREAMYWLTDVALNLFAAAVAGATVLAPLLLERTVAPATYDLLARPLGVAVVALMALCPLCAWGAAGAAEVRRSLPLPAASAAVSAVLWWRLGFTSDWWGFAGLVVCGFAVGAVLASVRHAARREAGDGAAESGRAAAGLRRALLGSRTRTAGWIAHLGLALTVAGLLGSSVYATTTTALIEPRAGAAVRVAPAGAASGDRAPRYTLTFTGLRREPGDQGSLRTYAGFDVTAADGSTIGVVEPHTDVYPVSGAAVRAVILGRPFEDVFVVTDEPFDEGSGRLALRVVVFPLVRWVWIGSLLLCGGAAVSLWPRRRRAPTG